jgi:transposase-like protein
LAELDILGPSDLRRIWSAEEKAALLAEVNAEGGKVRLIARRRGVLKSPICG